MQACIVLENTKGDDASLGKRFLRGREILQAWSKVAALGSDITGRGRVQSYGILAPNSMKAKVAFQKFLSMG